MTKKKKLCYLKIGQGAPRRENECGESNENRRETDLNSKDRRIGIGFFKISGIPHIYVARIIAVNESFVCLEGSHPIYFDYKNCQIEEIEHKGKTIYRRKEPSSFQN